MAGDGSPEQFIKDVTNFKLITFKKVNTIIKYISIDLFKSIIEDTPVDSGRAKSSWVFSDWSPKFIDQANERFVKGKKVDRKKAITSFDKTGVTTITKMTNQVKRAKGLTGKEGVRNSTYFLTNSVPYVKMLEEGGYPPNPKPDAKTNAGYSTQAVGGFIKKNLQRFGKQTFTHYALVDIK